MAPLVSSLVERLAESPLPLLLSRFCSRWLLMAGFGICASPWHHDPTMRYSVAMVATAGAVLQKKMVVARWTLKGQRWMTARGLRLSVLLLMLQVSPAVASLVSEIVCTSMGIDRCGILFLLVLCSPPTVLWGVHVRKRTGEEGKG